MIDPEERQEIIDAAVEKALLSLPEVVGHLMTSHAALLDLNRAFYTNHPDFVTQKPLVQSVIEQIEGQHPTWEYKDLLTAAIPVIRERMKTIEGLDMTTVKRPDRHMPHLTITEVNADKPHGEL